ncbi:arginase, hepatic [Hyalella azteca]|uniref:Arginase, hepatic n=1 Tax=Hyalella azteca TaxID=294128 RepID=A0A979FGQ0_HYAAZ|nr:arginase, hepatic [Hyalella azteca]
MLLRKVVCRVWTPASQWVPQCRKATTIVTHARIGVLGAPFEKGQKHAGVAQGPSALRKTGFLSALTERGLDVLDYGDVREDLSTSTSSTTSSSGGGGGGGGQYSTGPEGEKDFYRVLEYNKKLAVAVADVLRDDRLCVTLGGDHTIAIGTIAGHAASLAPHQKVSVLWVDAHADINTGASSHTSHMHGMAAGFHMAELQHSNLPCGFPQSSLNVAQIAYIGLRDVDVAEAMAVMGGLTVREGCVALEAARATGHLRALDLVEVNPSLADTRGVATTTLAARTLLYAALSGH